jgi:tetratricopeptide (TPR) repeat protein
MEIPIPLQKKRTQKNFEPFPGSKLAQMAGGVTGMFWHFFSLERASRITVYLTVFFLPLFFLPGIPNVLDFPKQSFLLTLSFFGVLFWLAGVLNRGEVSLKLHILYVPLILLLLAWGISTIFSYSRYGSFWGWPLQVSESFLTLLSFALFFFLVHQLFSKREEILMLFLLILSSAAIASLFGIAQLFGRFLLPFDFAKTAVFNTIGSPSALAVFAAVLLPVAVRLFPVFAFWQVRILLGIAAGLFLFTLLVVNSWIAWVVLFIGAVALFVISFVLREFFEPRLMVLPVFLIIISASFLILRNPIPILSIAPSEVYPSNRATIQISLAALRERPILGTGPGTFLFDYTKFKSVAVNQTIFWNARFPVGASKIIENFGTTGILGAGTLLVFIGALLFCLLRQTARDVAERFLVGTIGLAFVSSAASLFLSWSITSLLLPFWLFAAFVAIISRRMAKEQRVVVMPKIDSPEQVFTPWFSALVSFALVIVILVGGGLLYFNGLRFFAEFAYQNALKEFSQGNFGKAQDGIVNAIRFNPNQDIYWRDSAQIQLMRLKQEILPRADITSDQMRQTIAVLIDNAVRFAKQATDLEPKNALNWLVRGSIYQDLIGIAGDAENVALNLGYDKARELDPTNPYIITQIGRVYLQKAIFAQQQRQPESVVSENITKAEEYFKKAIELKGDFAPAHFQLAVVAQMRGDVSGTIAKLQETKRYVTTMQDLIGLSFQLGVLYYQQEDYEQAKRELEFAVSQNQNYSNAHYFLGLIYDKEGRKEDAIRQFELIEALNPDNQEVKKILANLRGNQPALAGIVQEQPPKTPVEEGKPQEVK